MSTTKCKSEAKSKWKEALRDAELKLREVKAETIRWEGVVRTCRQRIEEQAPWPEAQRR